MSAPKRKRDVQVNFRVSPEELALIEQKMAQLIYSSMKTSRRRGGISFSAFPPYI